MRQYTNDTEQGAASDREQARVADELVVMPINPNERNEMSKTVIVRGMTEEWFIAHFKDMAVYFGGDPRGIPARDAQYIGFYLEAPASAITHIGIVDRIERSNDSATFHLKAIIKLDRPIKTIDQHAIRKQEYWTLEDLGINQISLIINDFAIAGA